MDSSSTTLNDLLANLKQGMRCVFFRPVDLSRLVVSAEQLTLLILLDLMLTLAGGYLVALPNPAFYPYSLPTYALTVMATLFGALLVARFIRLPSQFLQLSIIAFSVGPALNISGFLLHALERYPLTALADEQPLIVNLLAVAVTIWALMVVLRTIALTQGKYAWRGVVSMLAWVLIASLPTGYFADSLDTWYPEEVAEDDSWKPYRDLNVEDILYAQPSQLTQAFSSLKPGIAGQTDVYFLGFAGYARENVFRNEVSLAKKLFDDRFGTKNRSLSLINHLDTHSLIPLATSNNLRMALKHLGSIMNKDEDILVLFMTSHGSRDHTLSVDFWPLTLNDVTPAMLKQYLDDAGIRWRAVMVSACYSGGFVAPLQSAETLIATAASADRTSFGCGKNRELTYFGEAFLRDELAKSYSMTGSLQAAIQTIGTRETREKLQPSQPQLSIGKAIAEKLSDLEASLPSSTCTTALTGC